MYLKKTEIWDSHVHLFPPEIYENWEKYAARDNWFALLTKKPENGKGTEILAFDTFAQAQQYIVMHAGQGDVVLYENDLPDTFK